MVLTYQGFYALDIGRGFATPADAARFRDTKPFVSMPSISGGALRLLGQ
jgi:hypothetical protein